MRCSQLGAKQFIKQLFILNQNMLNSHSYKCGCIHTSQLPPLLSPAKQTAHPPSAHSIPVKSQPSHLPPQLWVLLLLHQCVQPHQRCWGPLHLPLPPACPELLVQEAAGEAEPEHGCRSRWCQPESPKGLCRSAMWDLLTQWIVYLSLNQMKVPVLRKTS